MEESKGEGLSAMAAAMRIRIMKSLNWSSSILTEGCQVNCVTDIHTGTLWPNRMTKLIDRGFPISDRHRPLLVGEDPTGFEQFAQGVVQRLDGVGRIDHLADLGTYSKKTVSLGQSIRQLGLIGILGIPSLREPLKSLSGFERDHRAKTEGKSF